MGKTKAYEDTLDTVVQVKQGIGNFELFLRKAIAAESTCSPEACNDPDNHIRRKTMAADIYYSVMEFAERNKGNVSGDIVKMLVDVLKENLANEDKVAIEEVLQFAQSRGFHTQRSLSGDGDEIVILLHR